MKLPLHVLHLEDDQNDAALILETLEADGITCATTRVQNHDDFVAALELGGIDLILSDFSLPGFDGLWALKIARERVPELPVILVSGTLGEERAVDALKNGATDYVLKEHLVRLPPAVRRSMQEVEARTERRRLEAQFLEAQKMEAVGQLAGGVAHDFNNILAVIMGYGDMLATELGPDSPLRKYTEEIRQASERAAGLTRQLLVFSRKQAVQPTVLDLNDVVNDMEQMLRRLIHEHIEMTIEPGKHHRWINADAGHVGQVLMNLVVNARDAMPAGGKITIATSHVILDESGARAHPGAVPGGYVMLSVSDTGTGMTEEVKAHVFDAFFTTKELGKGTGLGLATCQTVVRQSGGHINVRSEVGKGTTFEICFPQVRPPEAVVHAPVTLGPLPCGTETLLFVEDEPAIRHMVQDTLEAQGYVVLLAANGQEALHVTRDHKGPPIRLVITDVIMPLMGGEVLAEWLKISQPDLKILFTSGYAEDTIANQGVLDPGVEFLPKPYTSAVLIRKIREVLDNGTAPRLTPAGITSDATSCVA